MEKAGPGKEYAIAVDIGGTKLATAIIDDEGEIKEKLKVPVKKTTAQESVRQIVETVREVLGAAGAGWTDIAAAGVAVPGIYFAGSGTVWAPNLPGWDRFPLRRELEAEIPAPVVVDSDRAAYVYGEQWLGVARGLSDVVFVAVGTGIGAGVITGGRLCRGASDIAGSVGWFALNPQRQELYRKVGCWEAEAAGPAIARRAGAESAEAAVAAARSGDPAARRALEEAAAYLGMGIANIVSILNPEMVVLGGGLMQSADLLIERIRREVLEWAQPAAAKQVRLEVTKLGEDAGLLGAARLALLEKRNHVSGKILRADVSSSSCDTLLPDEEDRTGR